MQNLIVYEDEDIIIVNKPQGMPTQSSETKKIPDLYNSLQKFLNQRDHKKVYLALHHRLDAATPGLVLFCKNKKYNKYITDLFREKQIEKKYLAKVDISSAPPPKEWTIENKLSEYKIKHFKKAKSSKSGKTAITKFKLIAINESSAIIECYPLTGRLHQIRVHLSEANLPIQGDFHYNKNFKKNDTLKLCAYSLSFNHPRSKETLTVEIEPDFKLDTSSSR